MVHFAPAAPAQGDAEADRSLALQVANICDLAGPTWKLEK
jgi:hypothetical protein